MIAVKIPPNETLFFNQKIQTQQSLANLDHQEALSRNQWK